MRRMMSSLTALLEVAAREPSRAPDDDGQRHGAEADHQRGLRAVQQAGEDVAAQPVGAEEVVAAGGVRPE